jgi:hypothetical protein
MGGGEEAGRGSWGNVTSWGHVASKGLNDSKARHVGLDWIGLD